MLLMVEKGIRDGIVMQYIDMQQLKKKNERLQYDINRKAENISALTSSKIDKFEYLTGEKILPPVQKEIIEKSKFDC